MKEILKYFTIILKRHNCTILPLKNLHLIYMMYQVRDFEFESHKK